jgi:DNA (cytosine-5)-methyltransferase 1
VCSGIETFSLAVAALGWEPAWFAEIDPFCCELLKERYPHVPNLGDITQIEAAPAVDAIVAGTPCQSFSVQGNRKGLDDERGQLAIRFTRILNRTRPRWLVWENVPGVLQSSGGQDFAAFLTSLGKCGYGIAYRVLDAQYFGVPQRRRRLFVVGHYRDWRPAAAVLFDAHQHRTNEIEAAGIHQRAEQALSGALLGWTGDETPKHGIEIVPTLRAQQGGEGVGIAGRGVIRRLTVTEWERLQGIPDGYTNIAGSRTRARMHAIGNAFCVNVLAWVAGRIALVERGVSDG